MLFQCILLLSHNRLCGAHPPIAIVEFLVPVAKLLLLLWHHINALHWLSCTDYAMFTDTVSDGIICTLTEEPSSYTCATMIQTSGSLSCSYVSFSEGSIIFTTPYQSTARRTRLRTIIFDSITLQDVGTYTCLITSSLGDETRSTTRSFRLHVGGNFEAVELL